MAVDKRSQRTKLKDKIVGNIHERIEQIESLNAEKKKDIERDELMVAMLKDQLANIEKLCDDGQKAT